MSDEKHEVQRKLVPPEAIETRSLQDWATLGVVATDVALHAYQTFKPAPKPEPPPPQDPPQIILPPGTDDE